MASPISTDIELAGFFSTAMADTYHEAVEFSQVLPSHALVRFRNVLEGLCNYIARQQGVRLAPGDLFDSINMLAEAGAVTFGFRDRCHQLRKLCNPGAHDVPSIDQTEEVKSFQIQRAQLAQRALEARELALWAMEQLYCTESGTAGPLGYRRVTIQTQEWKDILFSATVNDDADAKYKAGLWCEAEVERRLVEDKGLIASDEFEKAQDFLQRLAATFYQASYLLKPNVDAMFRYAQYVERGKIDGDRKHDAVELIATAANAGHGDACDHYAAILYEGRQDYVNAERLWLLAAQNNVTRAYYCLWVFHTDGKACAPDHEKGIGFLKLGVEQDCRDCLYALGRCYHEGSGVPKDIEQARQFLWKASELGHGIARFYLAMQVNGGTKIMADELAEFGNMLLGETGSSSNAEPLKLDPYAFCACGSGKKYKWCCMPERSAEKTRRSLLGHVIPPKRY